MVDGWHLGSTSPEGKKTSSAPAAARLLYRISCKGPVSETVPRSDSDEWVETNITPPYRSAI